jgi:hypothetical protein
VGATAAGHWLFSISLPIIPAVFVPSVSDVEAPAVWGTSIAVLQFSWSFQKYAGWLFLEKKAISRHHVPSTPTGKPL